MILRIRTTGLVMTSLFVWCIATGDASWACYLDFMVISTPESIDLETAQRRVADLAGETGASVDARTASRLHEALEIEMGVVVPRLGAFQSSNGELAQTLFERRETSRSSLPALMFCFTPESLGRLPEEAKTEWQDPMSSPMSLLLYCSLPETSATDAFEAIQQFDNTHMRRRGQDDAMLVLDAIRARHGDAAAEGRLLSYFDAFDRAGDCRLDMAVVCLAYSNSNSMILELASRLTGEELIRTGGFDQPKRSYALRAMELMNAELRAAIRYTEGAGDSRKILAALDWCEEHVKGYEYDKTVRIRDFAPCAHVRLDGGDQIFGCRFIDPVSE